MKLCLVMMARVQVENNEYLLDKKNINVIERYLKYFDQINVVARKAKGSNSLYPREVYRNSKVTFSLFDELDNPFNLLKYTSDFKKGLRKNMLDSDLVLCWAEPKSDIIVSLANKLNKTCVVYVGVCTRDALLAKKSLAKKVAGWVLFFSIRNAIKKADYVHYVTEQELQRRYPSDSPQIGASYVSINTDVSDEYKRNKIQSYKEQKEIITLGLIGYLNEIKGIDTAIKALSRLNKNYELKILGGGNAEIYKYLTQKYNVSDRVTFEGTLPPGEAVINWLESIDIYIQPSRTEGLPRATMEAMSRGCPTVTSTAMGLMELTDPKWLHKPGDWKALSKLIEELANDSNELEKQSARSFKISSKYNRKVLDEQIDTFFKDIIESVRGFD